MRLTRTCMGILMVAALFLVFSSPVLAQPKGGALMPEDVFTPISQGYDFIQAGNYAAAKEQFQIALKRDRFNPFALNNLAVIQEHDGQLNDALANLKDATTHAADYSDKVAQTCFVGGGCMAAKPLRGSFGGLAPEKGITMTPIAQVIQENTKKLEAKIAATKTPPPPGSPPAVMPVPPKTKAEPTAPPAK